jgi:hypothetical protein
MAVEKRKRLGVGVGYGHVGFDYSTDIIQQIVKIEVGVMTIIPHLDGKGYSIVTRFDAITFTVITKRFVADGILKRSLKELTEVLENKPDGVYLNGRKL